MPLVTISLSESWSTGDQKLIADGVHEAIAGVGFPQTDRFQKIHSLPPERFLYDERHPDLTQPQSEKFVLIEITISFGRSVEFKKDLLTRVVRNLEHKPGIAPHDVIVLFVETARENWAFAGGIQYYR
ncbi:MAG: tautomerase family protein [Desulfobacterales bacterium]|jgi:phenylpyruvate tautomerase PptA (4-oxalocrotonate tautomerase family)